MPSKNIIKQYVEGGVYHIYNRGINKEDIFLDNQDYSVFLFFLKLYLDNPENLKNLDPQKRKYLSRKNFYKKIDLLCYCLMPNHFHLLIKQIGERDIAEFMKCVVTNFSMYFNNKYERVGTLFQGRYKAVLVKDDSYLLHLSRYIHLNPVAKGLPLGKLVGYSYSSYQNYLDKKNTRWVNPEFILSFFGKDSNIKLERYDLSSYQDFVEKYKGDSKEILGDLALD